MTGPAGLWTGLIAAWLAQAAPQPAAEAPPARASSVVSGVAIEAAIEPAAATVGDVLRLTIAVEAAAELTIAEPQAVEGFEPFVLRSASHAPAERLGDGRLRRVSGFELALYETGAFSTPELVVPVEGVRPEALAVPRVGVSIRSVLAQGETEAGLAELRPLRSLEGRWRWQPWLAGLGALAALTLLAWLMLRRRGRAVDAEPALEPHEAALKALGELRTSRLLDEGPEKLFYACLTDILKGYLGRRYSFEALGDTTDELLQALRGLELELETRIALADLLREADMVKFAAARRPRAELENAVDRGVAIVKNTRPRPVPGPVLSAPRGSL